MKEKQKYMLWEWIKNKKAMRVHSCDEYADYRARALHEFPHNAAIVKTPKH